jgi:hypothetical protein
MYSSAASVSRELIVIVLPSWATSLAPKDHRMEYRVVTESVVWLMAKPTGWPRLFSFRPARSRSSQVSGAFSPTFSNRSIRWLPGNEVNR